MKKDLSPKAFQANVAMLAVGAVLVDGSVLLVKSSGSWGLLCTEVAQGEDASMALVRAAKSFGLDVTPGPLIGTVQNDDLSMIHICSFDDGVLSRPEDVDDCGFFSLSEAASMTKSEVINSVLSRFPSNI